MGCLSLSAKMSVKPDLGFRVVTHAALSVLVLGLVHSKNTSCTTPSLPAKSETWRGEDFVTFENEPSVVIDGYSLSVRYLCTRPCVVGVELVVPSEWRTGPLVFQKTWLNQHHLGTVRRRSLPLRVPVTMVYQTDFYIRDSKDAQDVMLRGWLDHLERLNGSIGGLNAYHTSLTQVFKMLRTLSSSQRPVKQHSTCLSWGAELLWKLSLQKVSWCPHESGTVPLLTFPLASTGETFGVIRRLKPFINQELEDSRSKTIEEARLTLSLWIYLLGWCDRKFCGLLQHVNLEGAFDTPVVLLTDTGDIVFQAKLSSGEDRSFKSYTALPLKVWLRLDIFVDGTKVMLKVRSHMMDTRMLKKEYTYDFQADIHHNDTSGYFVIGGSKFIPSIQGYFGPIRYYRLGTYKCLFLDHGKMLEYLEEICKLRENSQDPRNSETEVWNPLSPEQTAEALNKTHWVCDEIKKVIAGVSQALRDTEDDRRTCRSFYMSLKKTFGRLTCRALPLSADRRHKSVLWLLRAAQRNLPHSGSWSGYLHFGRWSYKLAKRRLARVRPGSGPVASLVPLLQVSSCCGNSKASLLLAAVYLAGFGVPEDNMKGHVYSLVGAQADGRLALMHLGYKHTQGIDGFPRDYDVAYCYYGNVGKQTCTDRWRVSTTEQYTTELIHLTDDKALKSQMDEDHDIFQYLKFQAERGDLEAQKTVARMLFWGQQGVSKDIEGAFQWYAESAMRMTDAQAMYDYSILLLKGHGTKKNMTLGLRLMEKAASMGLPAAVNGMGWYYSTFMADLATAVRYFEQAAQNNNRDAIYNLGLFYLAGNYPGKPGKNQTAAFQHFLRASLQGHLEAGIETAWYYATGVLPAVGQDPKTAVLLLKHISEQNGYLGSVLRKGLNAYLRRSRVESLLSYLLAAETGLGVAQNNVAHLCEELGPGYSCEWRYYNQSTYNYQPNPSGFLKMGDYYYHGQENRMRDVALSILMYASAAFVGSPQGIFNLAAMIEMGHDIPENILERLKVTKQDQQDKNVVLEKLYQRCRQLEDEEDLTPCSLALFRVQLTRAWRKFTAGRMQCSLVYIVGSGIIAALLSIFILSPTPRGVTEAAFTHGGAVNRDDSWLGRATQSLRWQNWQRVRDWAWSLLGACLCAAASALLSQFL